MKTISITLVFADWRGPDNKSIYRTLRGIELSIGSLHSGSTFDGTITLADDDVETLRDALASGESPLFSVDVKKP